MTDLPSGNESAAYADSAYPSESHSNWPSEHRIESRTCLWRTLNNTTGWGKHVDQRFSASSRVLATQVLDIFPK